jgi:PKD repeat protein/N-acetylneuraminic acid mutarotase
MSYYRFFFRLFRSGDEPGRSGAMAAYLLLSMVVFGLVSPGSILAKSPAPPAWRSNPASQLLPHTFAAVSQPLDFQARLACQLAVEEVYWRQRIWPVQNAGPKPALQDTMPPLVVQAKVEDYLRKSNALEALWQQPITGEQLQAELDRLARNTQQPQVLQEMWAKLGNDPYLVAECLARSTLADRLIRNWYAYDERFHGPLRAQIEAEVAVHGDVGEMVSMSGQYSEVEWIKGGVEQAPTGDQNAIALDPVQWDARQQELGDLFDRDGSHLPIGQISAVQENEDRFYVTAILDESPASLHLATVSWAKTPFSEWWQSAQATLSTSVSVPQYDYRLPPITSVQQQADAWKPTAAIPTYTDGTAVWTGTEMIIWGGSASNEGYRYNPTTDTWTTMNTNDAPIGRRDHTAVWTGTEMIVWGGCDANIHMCDLGDGGRYDPVTDSWIPIGPAAGVSPRTQHTAVWTGSEMIVWGGCRYGQNDACDIFPEEGGRYDPTTDSWQATSTVNSPDVRTNPLSVWTGSEMIIWMSADAASPGGRYSPATDTWQTISVVDAPSGYLGSLVWTGSEMIAWGGCIGTPMCNTPMNTGGRYDPTTDTWTPTSTADAPDGRWFHSAVWTGDEMIIWGGYDSTDYRDDGGRYDPTTDTWVAVGTVNTPSARASYQAVWTGSLMIVWGGFGLSGDPRLGGRYDPSTDAWTPTSYNDPQSRRARHAAIWTGAEMLVWGGEEGGVPTDTGRRYDPTTDAWQTISDINAPDARIHPSAIWTGSEMIVWGGQYGTFVYDTGGRYDPATDTWTPTSMVNAPEGRAYHAAVWSGSEMLVWGGSTYSELYDNTGGRYDPNADAWTAMSMIGAPDGRRLHTGIWTGDEFVVWGGSTATGWGSATGGRYNPTTDSWTPTSTSGAPVERVLHTAIWNGSEMIVWGGAQTLSPWTLLASGGRYNPVTDTWIPTSTANTPDARARHTAVWTGQEMIVWGGCTSANCLLGDNAGGRYDPQADAWQATSTAHAPEARQWHTAVWTGYEMIVWGGVADRNGYTHTGGRYITHVSQPEELALTVAPAAVPIGYGQAAITATVSLSDGTPVSGWTVSFQSDLGTVDPAADISDENGHAFSLLYAGPVSGTATIVAEATAALTATGAVEFYVPDAPTASFSSNSPVCADTAVVFTNTSAYPPEVPVEYLWDFGDGITSTLESPEHLYALPDTYSVVLTAANVGGTDMTTDSILISPFPEAAFSFAPDLPRIGETAFFTDTSSGGPTAWDWDFGDGVTSTLQHPSHVYETADTYTVTLRVQNDCGWSPAASQTITVMQPSSSVLIYLPQIVKGHQP